jgi:putative two-component system response regulator
MMQHSTIMIVDDEEHIRKLLKHSLLTAGYSCLEAGGAQEALALMSHNAVALALLDINLPGRTGVELLGDIVSTYPDTAAIMVTAITDNETCIDCMHRGADDYITKPFNFRELKVKVEQALENRILRLDNRKYQQHLEEMVEAQAVRIRASFFNAIASLAQALEAKDKYTAGHSERVAGISVGIARQLGLSTRVEEKVRTAALVHDIGKIGVSEAILNKADRLTDEEYRTVCLHSTVAERILKPITDDDEILSMVRHHHERYDGKGYPDGIKGECQSPDGFPYYWSIIGVADSYDAMVSDRPYRKAMPQDEAFQEIKMGSGSQFDPVVVDALLKIDWQS